VVRTCYDCKPQHWLGYFKTDQLGDLKMMTFGLKRSVLPLLFVASVLLSGCVSKGKYNNLQGQYNDLQGKYNNLQGQYNNLQGQYKQLQQSSAAQAAQSSAEIAAMKKELAADKVHVSRLQDAIKFTVNSDLLFRSGSWQMSPQGQEIIAKLAPRLAPFQQSKLVVNGYTDNGPVGPALQRQGITSNEVLSQKRAEAVMQYLISQGVKPDMISAQGFGAADPIASNDTAQGRAQNRRVELTLAGQTSP
jgi:chemotaxis protein MotB